MTGGRLFTLLKESPFNDDLTICHFRDLSQKVTRLHLCPHKLRIVINVDLISENAAIFVLFVNELVSNLEHIL